MKKLKFGTRFNLGENRIISGAELYVLIFQICSLLPALYTLTAAVLMSVVTRYNPLSAMFDYGISALPRWEVLALSLAYRATAKELIAHFAILALALALGVASKKLFRGKAKTAVTWRVVFALLIAADLVVRLLPFGFNGAFGTAPAVAAFVVRLICLSLIVLDLWADRKNQDT